ncbi:BTAD domain-containing putative transcriptional regulator [Streptomyces sp. NPDC003032]
MQFLMLGPLEVADGGGHELRAAKHRSLLAVLLVNGNHVVSLDRLIDELWEKAPPTAANLVRQYISHLRKLLGQCRRGPEVELRTHPAGYRLVIPPRATDVEEFEHLVGRTQEQLRTGQPAQAGETARKALIMWRGPAFADVPCGQQVSAEQARLEELRICAEELRAQADLSAGHFTDAVSELTALTVQYPLRERLYAHLMRALSASGRTAEALAAYRSARRHLTSELGLEPGQELKDLERSLLAGEGVLAPAEPIVVWQSDAPSPTVLPPSPQDETQPGTEAVASGNEPVLSPTQLPPGLTHFVGRQRETGLVRQSLGRPTAAPGGETADVGVRTCPPVVVLCGLGGIGKTTLAVQLGHELRTSFPDGQLLLHLRGTGRRAVHPVETLGHILEALGCTEADLPHGLIPRQQLYRRLLTDRRLLLVLDDATDEPHVRELLPGRTRSAVLITSRSKLAALDNAHRIALSPLAVAESVTLLAMLIGTGRVAAEPEAAHRIATACDGLPLAVRTAAAALGQLPHRPLHHMAQRLTGDGIFDELLVGDLDVRQAVADIYDTLGPEEQLLLRSLADDEALVSALSEQDLDGPADTVDRLVQAGALEFIGTDDEGRALFRCAALLKRYAAQHADLPGPPTLLRAHLHPNDVRGPRADTGHRMTFGSTGTETPRGSSLLEGLHRQ